MKTYDLYKKQSAFESAQKIAKKLFDLVASVDKTKLYEQHDFFVTDLKKLAAKAEDIERIAWLEYSQMYEEIYAHKNI